MSAFEGSESGYAPALHACHHVAGNLLTTAAQISDVAMDGKCSVAGCGNTQENWLCLSCGALFCGRFANKHMLAHFESTGHCVAAGLGDLSFWCYACDSYLHHLKMAPVFAAYASLHQLKFGEAPPVQPNFAVSARAPAVGSEAKADGVSTGRVGVSGLTPEQLANPIVDRILGTIYGNALGDALGLATEFMNKEDVLKVYGKEPIPFPNFVRNRHNSRWQQGDWTDDTDQMILILETILEAKGNRADERVFAQKLLDWCEHGFPELGDSAGMGLGMTVGKVVSHKDFTADPHKAAKEVWVQLNKNAGANGAVMRTSVLGCWQYADLDRVVANTEQFARVTHWDSRCVASCVAVTATIALILQGRPCSSAEDCEALAKEAEKLSLPLVDEEHKAVFAAHLNARSLNELKLDEGSSIGYTLKCLGCGMYGLRSQQDFKATLRAVAVEAGDADTNGAVCGAVLGCKLVTRSYRWGANIQDFKPHSGIHVSVATAGYAGLPHDWLRALPNKTWLDKKVVALLQLMGLVAKA